MTQKPKPGISPEDREFFDQIVDEQPREMTEADWDAVRNLPRLSVKAAISTEPGSSALDGFHEQAVADRDEYAERIIADAKRAEMQTRVMIASAELANIIALAREIDVEAIREGVQIAERQHAIMPILDPTRYMREQAFYTGSAKVMGAFVKFRDAIDESTRR